MTSRILIAVLAGATRFASLALAPGLYILRLQRSNALTLLVRAAGQTRDYGY